jgi:hypothetical protein
MTLSFDKKEATITAVGFDWIFKEYSGGIDFSANYIGIDKNQFGYATDNAGYRNAENPKGDLFFDNTVDIDVYRLRIGGTFTKKWENSGFSFKGIVYPLSLLEVDQTTLIRPISEEIQNSYSNNWLDISYEARASFFYDFSGNWSFVGLGEYYFLPLEYNTISSTKNSQLSEITQKEEITEYTWMGKLVTPFKLSGDARFSIGYGQRIIDIDGDTSDPEHLISIGIDTTF